MSTPEPEENPFSGTPFEQIFRAMSSGQAPDLGALMAQMQRMFEPYEGHVNLGLAQRVAHEQLAAGGPDPAPSGADSGAVSDAVELAEQWLDTATELPRATTTAQAWSRAEWIERTIGAWGELVEPVAAQTTSALQTAMPEEVKAIAGPFVGMMQKAGGSMFGQQFGQALAALAGEVLAGTDIGVPLTAEGQAALLPANVRAFAEGLELPERDAFLFVALREAAHHRLFARASWLGPAVIAAILEVGGGTEIDVQAIESQLGSFDPTRPEALGELLSSGVLEPKRTPAQQAALARLETLLALVEGWVDEVVTQATADRVADVGRLREAMRRRRAAGGPAEQTFASLVGLELRPRRLRDAANLWAALRERKGAAARDAVWSHPDLMPGSADLDDPLGFGESESPGGGEDFDAALQQLLDDSE